MWVGGKQTGGGSSMERGYIRKVDVEVDAACITMLWLLPVLVNRVTDPARDVQ